MKAALPPALLALLLATAACERGPEPVPAAESTALLQQNAAQPGVVTLPSGLQYKVVKAGAPDGYRPKPGDAVKVHYEGRLPNGEVFDSSYESGAPAVFTVGQLVPGWNQALQLMKPGDVWELTVPPKLGYGEEGAGPIPPGSVLVFKMELLDVLPRESAPLAG
ncbi:MAG: FKBP-type peptidyl-prolyl cis-trans isomerase [Proteobacteria bacterium]|nr:FKBP-type peptidyl-prolyl cis-trans isomerase [Pseudomonadota bacterium]